MSATAPSAIESVYGPVESFFVLLGLTSPVSRALFGIGVGTLFVFLVKPSGAYNADHTPKQFSLFAPADAPKGSTTKFPWYFYPLVLGVLFGLFV